MEEEIENGFSEGEDSTEEVEIEVTYLQRQIQISGTANPRKTTQDTLKYCTNAIAETKGNYNKLMCYFNVPNLAGFYPKGKGGKRDLNMKRSGDRWRIQDGFRELVSNFYDEILERIGADEDVVAFQNFSTDCLHGKSIAKCNEVDSCVPKYKEYLMVGTTVTDGKHYLYGKIVLINKTTTSGMILLINYGAAIPRACWVTGTSLKQPSAIGRFGEGMKKGILAILGENAEVTYYTNNEKWDWKMMYNQSGIKTLHVVTKKPKGGIKPGRVIHTKDRAPKNTVVEIRNTPIDAFDTKQFLFLEPAQDYFSVPEYGAILFSNLGELFVKKVFAERRNDVEFGYNFDDSKGDMLSRDRKSIPSKKQVECSIASIWNKYLPDPSCDPDKIAQYLQLLIDAPSTGRVKKEILVASDLLSKEACIVLAHAYSGLRPDKYPMDGEDLMVSKIISKAKQMSGDQVSKYLYNILIKSEQFMDHEALKQEALDLLTSGNGSSDHFELIQFYKAILFDTNDGEQFDDVRFVDSESVYSSAIDERVLYINSLVFRDIDINSSSSLLKAGFEIATFFGSNDVCEKQRFNFELYEKIETRFNDLKNSAIADARENAVQEYIENEKRSAEAIPSNPPSGSGDSIPRKRSRSLSSNSDDDIEPSLSLEGSNSNVDFSDYVESSESDEAAIRSIPFYFHPVIRNSDEDAAQKDVDPELEALSIASPEVTQPTPPHTSPADIPLFKREAQTQTVCLEKTLIDSSCQSEKLTYHDTGTNTEVSKMVNNKAAVLAKFNFLKKQLASVLDCLRVPLFPWIAAIDYEAGDILYLFEFADEFYLKFAFDQNTHCLSLVCTKSILSGSAFIFPFPIWSSVAPNPERQAVDVHQLLSDSNDICMLGCGISVFATRNYNQGQTVAIMDLLNITNASHCNISIIMETDNTNILPIGIVAKRKIKTGESLKTDCDFVLCNSDVPMG
ncbi:hypothetical protein BC833DRAFT_604453 [Globomyces pollinis-pini]|nr:hypothetical protein BC833DRAFT_604453 [Globomyces pollinis-pini]